MRVPTKKYGLSKPEADAYRALAGMLLEVTPAVELQLITGARAWAAWQLVSPEIGRLAKQVEHAETTEEFDLLYKAVGVSTQLQKQFIGAYGHVAELAKQQKAERDEREAAEAKKTGRGQLGAFTAKFREERAG